jgi:integrase
MVKIRFADGSGKAELKFLIEDVDRHGNVRLYFRRTGHAKVRLRQPPGSDAFMKEYRGLVEGTAPMAPATEPGRQPAAKGSLRWLIESYYASGEYKRLDDRTRHVRRQLLDALCIENVAPGSALTIGALPYATMPPSKVRLLRDAKAAAPETGNARVKALRRVFAHAIENDLADRNPAKDVPYIKTGSQGFHSWTIEEVLQYEEHHPKGTKARLALGLLLFTGQRRADVVAFGRQHMRDGWLTFTQTKNQRNKPVTLSIPVIAELKELIDATPSDHLTFLTTEFGKSFTSNGFGNRFRKWCDDAGLKHCSAHGLRKAGAAIAAENGATETQLMAVFGWKTMKEAERYTRAARQKVLAGTAMRLLVPDRS